MESGRPVTSSLRQVDYMESVNITDACLHIPMYPPYQQFLWLAVPGNYFLICCTTLRPILCSQDVHKVLMPFLELRASKSQAKSPSLKGCMLQLSENYHKTLQLLQAFGWLLNFNHTALQASPLLEYL